MGSSPTYHGHDVLHFLLDADRAFSKEEMHSVVTERFGADARFHTCSAEGMDVEALLAFLLARGKIVAQGDGYVVAGHRICDH